MAPQTERQKEYRKEHHKRIREYMIRYYIENRDYFKKYNRDRWQRLKREAVDAYGGKCVCCGESEIKFLTIEHTNGDGKEHRIVAKGSYGVYRDLQERGWPKDGYTIMCWNCNMARRWYGECPHTQKAQQDCLLSS